MECLECHPKGFGGVGWGGYTRNGLIPKSSKEGGGGEGGTDLRIKGRWNGSSRW